MGVLIIFNGLIYNRDRERRKAMSDDPSLATEILQELKAANKRLFIAFITVLVLWFGTIGAFIWYISLPVEYEEFVDIQNENGNANYVGRDLIDSQINNNGEDNGD